MSYIALYRRWRPTTFAGVVGQEHIIRTLCNQIEAGHIAHAYLFTGSRGTGKTSTAKIFARAINCASPDGAEACGVCPSCKALQEQESLDIFEIDAASNNGVDNIRELRDNIAFPPTVGKYKVYIIDEVHMLSTGAFNALLKTLEEPPAHAVFILATTEVHKLPATILSRCQRFDFKLIPVETIAKLLENILSKSGTKFDEQAILLIARSAEGAMRDALSIADVCMSYCGAEVHYEDVVRILGTADRSFLFEFSDALLASDTAAALLSTAKLVNEGRDIGVFTRDLMAHLRDILVCAICPDSPELKMLPQDIQAHLVQQSKSTSQDRLLRAIEILITLEGSFRIHTRPRALFETAVVRICTPQTEEDLSALRDRISYLEKQLENGAFVSAIAPAPKSNAPPEADAAPKTDVRAASAHARPAVKAPAGGDGSELWEALLQRIKKNDMGVYTMIRHAKIGKREGNVFTIYFNPQDSSKKAVINMKAAVIQSELEALCGEKLVIKAADVLPETKAGAQTDELLRQAMDLFGEENIQK